MKNLLIAGVIATTAMMSSAVFACSKPENKPEIPDASSVVTAQLVKANNDVKAYVQDMQTYLGCAKLPRSQENKELDDLKKFADDFNEVVRAFKARSAG